MARTRHSVSGQALKAAEKESLTNILKALAKAFPRVKYCQGMNFLAAVLFVHVRKDEELTFELFMALMARKGLIALFVEGVPDFHLRSFVFEKLLKKYVPNVSNHLQKLHINIEMITGNWFMTLFSGFFGYNVVMPILDNFFLEGWPAVYRVSLILMRRLEPNILKCSSRERI